MLSNRNIFANGVQMGGAIVPKQGQTLTQEQAQQLEEDIARRFRGVDKAHRWGVFRYEADIEELGITPKDAEFVEAMKLALEDVCRAYRVPLDLLGGQRTYANVDAARKAIWEQCLIPEKRFIETELGEQLLPMFPGQADSIEFDTSEVDALRANETEIWARWKSQIDSGAALINEYRAEQAEAGAVG